MSENTFLKETMSIEVTESEAFVKISYLNECIAEEEKILTINRYCNKQRPKPFGLLAF